MRHAQTLHRAGALPSPPSDTVPLDYEGRFLRRRVLTTESGAEILVDLAETVSLDAGDALQADDGSLIEIVSAPEPLLQVRGDLTRLAWHIGNRHTPCQIAGDHLLIRDDHVMADMLAHLGAEVRAVIAPFTPEGGAYGHGRTHGHSHGPAETGADHAHTHAHTHAHSHDHADHKAT